MEILLSKGASVDALSNRGTPLHLAATNGHHKTVQILLDHNADVCDCIPFNSLIIMRLEEIHGFRMFLCFLSCLCSFCFFIADVFAFLVLYSFNFYKPLEVKHNFYHSS